MPGEGLQATGGGQRTDAAIRTFLIADVRGYTVFTQERGDEAAAELAGRFADLAREVIESHAGTLVELRGDEALAVFDSARQALRTALDLQVSLVAATVADPHRPCGEYAPMLRIRSSHLQCRPEARVGRACHPMREARRWGVSIWKQPDQQLRGQGLTRLRPPCGAGDELGRSWEGWVPFMQGQGPRPAISASADGRPIAPEGPRDETTHVRAVGLDAPKGAFAPPSVLSLREKDAITVRREIDGP